MLVELDFVAEPVAVLNLFEPESTKPMQSSQIQQIIKLLVSPLTKSVKEGIHVDNDHRLNAQSQSLIRKWFLFVALLVSLLVDAV